jgi:hydroxyethylthiazole kinase-like uncharacterized protein yjeF
MRILNSAQMREADRRTIEEIGIPSIVLMENAGRQVVAAIEAMFSGVSSWRVAVLCGRGNNGGDGFVVARTLLQRGVDVSVFLVGSIDEVQGDARTNLEVLGNLGEAVVEINDPQAWELHFSEIRGCDLLVDALFGTGLKTPLTGLYETIAADVNASPLPVVALDIPSGLSADSPEPIGPCIDASVTVTLAVPKPPLILPPGEGHCGDVVIADIGLPDAAIESVEGPHLELMTREAMRVLIEPRPSDSHKGDYGRILLVAGGRGHSGAAHLSAMGALKCGAGLVTIATPRSTQPILAAMAPEYMTDPLDEGPEGGIAAAALEHVLTRPADVIAAGPGLGMSGGTVTFVRGLLERAGVPLVLDADALNAFADAPELLVGPEGRDVIITPHPGELARLVGVTTADVQASRIEIAQGFAETHQLYVVLKGHRSLVATPEGRVFVNPTGNPGMATGGMGDLLTGMIAAWLGQILDAEAACKLAVYLHGMAADLAEGAEGEVALTPSDVLAHIGDAILELTARRRVEKKSTDD